MPELDLTIFNATGTVPFKDQMDVLKSFYQGSPTKNVVWDFTRADEINITSDELRAIVKYTRVHSVKRDGGRTALVVNTELKFGLARMASTFAEIEETPWDMEVFENLQAAISWISDFNWK